MKHPIVYDPPTLGGSRAILGALLKLAGLALLLIALLGFPALSQQLAPLAIDPVRMPLLRESNPVAIMELETERARRDSTSRQHSIRGERQRRLAADVHKAKVLNGVGATIRFDVGSSRVRSDAGVTLGETLELLRNFPTRRIRIEGQADVPGSTASDITLAWDRAGAAKVWLTNHGMDPDRIDAVGYSEGRPVCEDRTNDCLSRIRRDEFLIVAGADGVVPASP